MAKKTFQQIAKALFLILVITLVMQILCASVYSVIDETGSIMEENSWLFWLLNFLPLYGFAIPTGVFVMRKLPVTEGERKRLEGGRFIKLMFITLFMMYAGNLIGTGLSYLLSGGTAENALFDLVLDNSPFKVIVIVILAPLLEEFVFRKQIIDRSSRYGEKTAIVFSALTFALFHMNFFQMFYAFGLGLVFGYVYLKTRRLRYPVIMHMIVNFMGSVLAPGLLNLVDVELLEDSTALLNLTEEAMGQMLPGLLIYCGYALMLFVFSVIGLVLLLRNVKKLEFVPAEEEIPKEQRFKTVYCNLWMILFVVLCLWMCVSAL